MSEEDSKEEEKAEESADAKEDSAKSKVDKVEIRNVLVVDDSAALRRVLVKYVSNKFHCEITEADNGRLKMN